MAVSRRALLRGTAALAGGACICRASTCCITPEVEPGSIGYTEGKITIDLDRAHSLAKIGSSVNVIDRGFDLIAVHARRSEYHVLSGLCTHYPRPLTYIPSRGVLQCNNFNHSIFGLDGAVIKGPAPTAIRKYEVRLVGRRLEIDV
jgi:nitrite reductase/ring-hydroxylating ferredoxin subunit